MPSVSAFPRRAHPFKETTMHWLTGLLAFAVTMLIFAMIVSSLVEMIHRVWHMRAKGLLVMLESLYDQVIAPQLSLSDSAMSAESFAKTMMTNRSVARLNNTGGLVSRLLSKFLDSSAVSHMSVEVFMQKLADNRLLEQGEEIKEDALRDIAQKFESFGDEVGVYFERRARLFSVGVAFFVAWTFYVHPYDLMRTYIYNPEIAASVADQSNEALDNYRALTERLDTSIVDGELSEQQATDFGAAVDALKNKINEGHSRTNALSSSGVPVGWSTQDGTVWNCFGGKNIENPAAYCRFLFINVPTFANAFWLLIGGFLVGLGAPFWARAVSSLTRSRELTDRIATVVNDAHVPVSSVATNPTQSVSFMPSTRDSNVAVKAFSVAASASINKEAR